MNFATGYVEMAAESLLDLADKAANNLETYRKIQVKKVEDRNAKKSWWNRDNFADRMDTFHASTYGAADEHHIENVRGSLGGTQHERVFVAMEALVSIKAWANKKIGKRQLALIGVEPDDEE